ncbi:hypothetical protein C8034_v007561 [Colletotrichum sidae]|uniref:Uncharacterized protein n=1 Tax=Colletotrichum sidae TaxID=1347389 RepID=A0A4R8T4M9_9PEZI|nr:hypothetical protein C8034_v007561 [Colletotrichum sidae]
MPWSSLVLGSTPFCTTRCGALSTGKSIWSRTTRTLGVFYETEGKLGRGTWTELASRHLESGILDGREKMREVVRQRGLHHG